MERGGVCYICLMTEIQSIKVYYNIRFRKTKYQITTLTKSLIMNIKGKTLLCRCEYWSCLPTICVQRARDQLHPGHPGGDLAAGSPARHHLHREGVGPQPAGPRPLQPPRQHHHPVRGGPARPPGKHLRQADLGLLHPGAVGPAG